MKAYLDTSVISALFDEKNPERKSLTKTFFQKIEDFEVYISEISIMEIERTPDLKLQNKMKQTLTRFLTLSMTEKAEWLAKEYIRHGAVPDSYVEDSYHIAIAVLNEIDYLLSWNFKHIVRKTTRDIVAMVNRLNNLTQIEIMTPAELL